MAQHNHADVTCIRRDINDTVLEGEVCHACHPVGSEPIPIPIHRIERTVDESASRHPAGKGSPPEPTLAAELAAWWRATAEAEIDAVVAKATEYGGEGSAIDLLDIGYDLARVAGREVDDEEAMELGMYFYLRGKVSRWTAAIMEGRRVSDDTLHDIGVYVRMAQRSRQVGGWPTGPKREGS